MEDPFPHPYTPSGLDDYGFLPPAQTEMLKTKVDNAHSEIKKVKAALESLLDLATSRAPASEAQSCDSYREFNFIKGGRHLKRNFNQAQNETSSARARFDCLLDVVVSLRSSLSKDSARELDYIKEMTRLNRLLQKAEADIERLKHRYRVATYASAVEAGKRYSKDTTPLTTRDGKTNDDYGAMQASGDIDIEQAQPDIDMEYGDVDCGSLIVVNGDESGFDSGHSVIHSNRGDCGVTNGVTVYSDEIHIRKALSMVHTGPDDFKVLKEATPGGSDSTKCEDHILDSPIGNDFDFGHDISIYMARFNNGETDLSQFSPDTLACLMELEEPFAPLKTTPVLCLTKEIHQEYRLDRDLSVAAAVFDADREHNDGPDFVTTNNLSLSDGTSAPPTLCAENELAKELQEIDFLELEDILAQEEALTMAFEQQVAHDLTATRISDNTEAIMEAFQGEEYFTPDLDFNGLRCLLNIKGEAMLDTELPPAVLQVGLDVKRVVVKGGNYLKKPLTKNGRSFSRRRLKGSKSFTELGPFESLRERDAAIRSNKRHAGRHDRSFPEVFRHGITYKPSITDTNVYRTIHIGNLPSDITVFRLLTRIRGGAIVSAVTCDTVRITGSKSALVVFQDAYAASAYVKFVANYPVGFEYQHMEVTLVPTPTWPMPIPVQKRMEDKKQTRCLNIPSFMSPNPDPLTLIEERKRIQKFVDLLKEELSGFNRLRFEAIYDAYVDVDNTLHLCFASIQAAGTAYGILQKERNKEFGEKAFFVADPCAKPLLDLFDPEELEAYLANEEVEEIDTASEDCQRVEEKYYSGKPLDKTGSGERGGHQYPAHREDLLEKEPMPQLETGDIIVLDCEAPVLDKADMEHHKAGITSFDHAEQEAIATKELAELSAISDTLLPNKTSFSTNTCSVGGPLDTPTDSTSSTSSSLPIFTPRSSPNTLVQDNLNSQNNPKVTDINILDLSIITNIDTAFSASKAIYTPAITQRVKIRPERQSWADIMIEEAEMEQMIKTAPSQVQAKSSSDSATKLFTPVSSSLDDAPSKASSTTASSQAKCTICLGAHANTQKLATCATASGENGSSGISNGTSINSTTGSQAVPRVFCGPISATGPMARITSAGIGGMRPCACNGNECCMSGCLCRSAPTL